MDLQLDNPLQLVVFLAICAVLIVYGLKARRRIEKQAESYRREGEAAPRTRPLRTVKVFAFKALKLIAILIGSAALSLALYFLLNTTLGFGSLEFLLGSFLIFVIGSVRYFFLREQA